MTRACFSNPLAFLAKNLKFAIIFFVLVCLTGLGFHLVSETLHPVRDEMPKLILTFVEVFILTFIGLVFVYAYIAESFTKKIDYKKALQEAAWGFPGFILYSLIWNVFFLIGLLLFVVPGFYALSVFSQAPLIRFFNLSDHAFKQSRELVKGHFFLALFIILLAIIPEILGSLDLGLLMVPLTAFFTVYFSLLEAELFKQLCQEKKVKIPSFLS